MAKLDLRAAIFHDDDAAREHLETLLWRGGANCPRCGVTGDRITKLQGKSTRPGVYKCKDCRKPFSVTVGTVMERSHIPLKYLYRVTTAHLAGNSSPAGYYALTVARGDRDHLKNEAKNYGFDGDFFPSVHLHYLAMFSNLQRQGFGSRVLMHAIERVYKISRYAGAYTMTLVSLDEKSTAFYQSLGFETYGPASQHPLMLLPIQSIVDLVEGTRPWPRALAPMLAAADAAKAAS